ncbi:hypothetical protein DL93DRAFT_2074339, partial [Clavulina sp. PMI_390]
ISSFRSQSKTSMFSHYRQYGNSKLLSFVVSEGPYVAGLVLSHLELSSMVSEILHRPLHIRHKDEAASLKNGRCRVRFRWSEPGGIIVVVTEARDFRVNVYQI